MLRTFFFIAQPPILEEEGKAASSLTLGNTPF
jgi:hypothetical protein